MPDRSGQAPEIPADPLDWRPQRVRPARTPRSILNAVVEPLWDGDHVLLHFDAARKGPDGEAWVLLLDETGEDVTESEADVAARLRGAIRTADAVVDGYLTRQATRGGTDVSVAPIARTRRSLMYIRTVEVDVAPPEPAEPGPVAFVAVDLLRIDGQDLFDVPLLERKRILDSIVVESELVRLSPYTQPPIDTWVRTWKAAGFRGAMLKAANSRYLPGGETDEWQAAVGSPRR
jgi:hypothetical protein